MQIIINVMFVVIAVVAIVYWYKFEMMSEQYDNLFNMHLDLKETNEQLRARVNNAEGNAEKTVKERLYRLVFQTQHYGSVKDLQNKIKTLLDSDGNQKSNSEL